MDETDIPNVKMGQTAEVLIDAYPNKTFKGKVTKIGESAVGRDYRYHQRHDQRRDPTSAEEAKDFKVVVTIDDPPTQHPAGAFRHRQGHNGDPPEHRDGADSSCDRPHAA